MVRRSPRRDSCAETIAKINRAELLWHFKAKQDFGTDSLGEGMKNSTRWKGSKTDFVSP